MTGRMSLLLSERNLARLLVILASTLSSLSGFFVESPILAEIPKDVRPIIMGFWRVAFGAMIFLPFVRKFQFHPVMLLSGLCVFGNGITFISAILLTTAATAIWLQNLTPFWVLIFSVLFLGEKITLRGVLPLGIALAGVGTILFFTLYTEDAPKNVPLTVESSTAAGNGAQRSDRIAPPDDSPLLSGHCANASFPAAVSLLKTHSKLLGLACGVLAGVFFAGILCTLRWLRNYDTRTVVAWNFVITLLCFFPLMLRTGYFPTLPQLAMLAAFGVFQFALPYLLIARGLAKISAQEGVLIVLLEPILTPVWVYLVWEIGEPWWTVVGGTLVLCGLVFRCMFGGEGENAGEQVNG